MFLWVFCALLRSALGVDSFLSSFCPPTRSLCTPVDHIFDQRDPAFGHRVGLAAVLAWACIFEIHHLQRAHPDQLREHRSTPDRAPRSPPSSAPPSSSRSRDPSPAPSRPDSRRATSPSCGAPAGARSARSAPRAPDPRTAPPATPVSVSTSSRPRRCPRRSPRRRSRTGPARPLGSPRRSCAAPCSPSASSARRRAAARPRGSRTPDRKSTRLNSSHRSTSYAVFCLKKKQID